MTRAMAEVTSHVITRAPFCVGRPVHADQMLVEMLVAISEPAMTTAERLHRLDNIHPDWSGFQYPSIFLPNQETRAMTQTKEKRVTHITNKFKRYPR